MDFLLNEKSLFGQFQSTEEFLQTLPANLRCFDLVKAQPGSQIWKIADFYKCRITKDVKIGDLQRYQTTDALLKLRLVLDHEIRTEPYWDLEPCHDYGSTYWMENEDVSATAIAEAAERGIGVLSFDSPRYSDRKLEVRNGNNQYCVHSVYRPRYLVEHFAERMGLDGDECLRARYEGTRIDCTLLEKEYGTRMLERREYDLLIDTLDKFVGHDSWESIGLDDGLEYKKYNPASNRENWFYNTQYRDKTIMKFRFSRKMRCYGFRKGERFRLLRLERDHKESDRG